MNQEQTNFVIIFKQLFKGQTNFVPKRWEINGTPGYSPILGPDRKPVPLNDDMIIDHLDGRHTIGVFPLLEDNTSHFIAADFDNHDGGHTPYDDVVSLMEVLEAQDIPAYALRSRSGKGYHVYVFFDEPIPARISRLVMTALLKEAGVETNGSSSFDRLFPSQDQHSGKSLGNLIALPFQGQGRENGNTLILDPETKFQEPYPDQFQILKEVKRCSLHQLEQVANFLEVDISKQTAAVIKNGNCVNYEELAKEAFNKLLECTFISWCYQNQAQVKEELWYAAISNVARISPGGFDLCHKLSDQYPTYSYPETQKKILQALNKSGPHTCDHIKNALRFSCGKDCNVKSPIVLTYRRNMPGSPNSIIEKTDLLSEVLPVINNCLDLKVPVGWQISINGVILIEKSKNPVEVCPIPIYLSKRLIKSFSTEEQYCPKQILNKGGPLNV